MGTPGRPVRSWRDIIFKKHLSFLQSQPYFSAGPGLGFVPVARYIMFTCICSMFNSLDSCGNGTLDHTAAAPVAASNALSRRISRPAVLYAVFLMRRDELLSSVSLRHHCALRHLHVLRFAQSVPRRPYLSLRMFQCDADDTSADLGVKMSSKPSKWLFDIIGGRHGRN